MQSSFGAWDSHDGTGRKLYFENIPGEPLSNSDSTASSGSTLKEPFSLQVKAAPNPGDATDSHSEDGRSSSSLTPLPSSPPPSTKASMLASLSREKRLGYHMRRALPPVLQQLVSSNAECSLCFNYSELCRLMKLLETITLFILPASFCLLIFLDLKNSKFPWRSFAD